jgi:poly(3-hydroxybutyrate) depolymerase
MLRRRQLVYLLPILVNLGLVLGSIRANFVTADEARLLPAGLAAWKRADFSLASDSPSLVKFISTLPVLLQRPNFYLYDLNRTDIVLESSLREREEQYAAYFAYGNASKYLALVYSVRAVGFVWWLLGAWLIAAWAHELHGGPAAYFAVTLWCFDPNVLAAEQVAAPALAVSVVFLAATRLFCRYLKRPSWGRAVVTGLALGIAQLVDFSALALYAVWPLLAVMCRRGTAGAPPSLPRIGDLIGQALAIPVLSVWVLNAGYGFQGTGFELNDYNFVSRTLGADPKSESPPCGGEATGNRFRGTKLGKMAIPLPADYLAGLDRRWHEQHDVPAGGTSTELLTDPFASVGAKVPLGTWVMVFWALALALSRHPAGAGRNNESAIWIPAAIIVITSMCVVGIDSASSAMVLLVPFTAVLASRLVYFLHPGRWRVGVLVLGLAAWMIASSIAAYPYSRGYINEVAAPRNNVASRLRHGPREGGADLLALKLWLRQHQDIHLSGLAVRDPLGARLTGLRYLKPPSSPGAGDAEAREPRRSGPYPGTYALDAYHLAQGKYAYFKRFVPFAQIGSSIFVFQVTSADARRIRRELGLRAIESSESARTAATGGLQYHTFVDSRGSRSRYAMFIPPEYRGDRPYPLILFLHGYGDRGVRGQQFTAVGLPPALESQKHGCGFFVLCPQGQSGFWHPEGDDTRRAMELLDAVQREYRIDPARIYLSGLSSGGASVWELGARFASRWAALVPVSSSGRPDLVPAIAGIPCWCFHNSHDPGSPVSNPRQMIAALRAAGAAPKYTEYFGMDHNAWDRAYVTSELYDWLILQRSKSDSGEDTPR